MKTLVPALEGYVFTNPVEPAGWHYLVQICALVCLDDFVSQELFVRGVGMESRMVKSVFS